MHGGEPLAPHDLWTAWNGNPAILISLGVIVLIYTWGTWSAWQSAGAGRSIHTHSIFYFIGGILALLLALVSPLDALSDVLFSAHMTQHMVLILGAAPLLVLSDFPLALLWALPRSLARRLGRWLNRSPALLHIWQVMSSPVSAWLLFTLVFWIWHAPGLYETALQSKTVHALEHIAFLTTAMLFWWVLFKLTHSNRVRHGIAIPYLFTTLMQSGIFGALVTFSTQTWYPSYTGLTASWGMTALQDQQLAGLVMWLAGSAVFTLLTIGNFGAWFRTLEQQDQLK